MASLVDKVSNMAKFSNLIMEDLNAAIGEELDKKTIEKVTTKVRILEEYLKQVRETLVNFSSTPAEREAKSRGGKPRIPTEAEVYLAWTFPEPYDGSLNIHSTN